MKKIVMAMAMLLLVLPVIVNAKSGVDVNGLETADAISNDDGTFSKVTPIYITNDSSSAEVSSAVVKFKANAKNNSEVTNITCTGASPYTVNTTTDSEGFTVCTFSVPEGTSGEKGSKVTVGELTVTIPSGASNCDIQATIADVKGSVNTGAELNYILVGCGVAAVAVIYFATKSKKKLYNI